MVVASRFDDKFVGDLLLNDGGSMFVTTLDLPRPPSHLSKSFAFTPWPEQIWGKNGVRKKRRASSGNSQASVYKCRCPRGIIAFLSRQNRLFPRLGRDVVASPIRPVSHQRA
jgi:hypothetical protein